MSARELVAGVVSLAGGSIIGRVRLQKVMYLLSRKGLGGPFTFSYHHYGPFSRSVDEAISNAKAFCGLCERIDHRVLDGAPFSIFELSDPAAHRPARSLGKIPVDQARSDISHMTAVTSTVIEIAATIFWLRYDERVADWRTELFLRKGAKAGSGRTEQALMLLADLKLENGLPNFDVLKS